MEIVMEKSTGTTSAQASAARPEMNDSVAKSCGN
jgi:hypothetical protein